MAFSTEWPAIGLLSLALGFASAVRAADNPYCPDGRSIRFAHYDEGGALHSAGVGGIDEDIREVLERHSGCRFEVSLQPRARIWTDLAAGTLDMAGSGVRNAEREQFVWFAPYVIERNQIVLGPRVPVEVRGFADFLERPSLRLGGVRSYSYSAQYDAFVAALLERKRLDQVNGPATVYRMFNAGRFDAFIASQFIVRHQFRKLNLQPPTRIEDWDPSPGTPSGLVMSKRQFSEVRARHWQQLMDGLIADGTVQRIVAHHLGAELAARSVYKPKAAGR